MDGTSVSVQVLTDKRWLYCGDGNIAGMEASAYVGAELFCVESLLCVTAKIRMAGDLV